MQPIREASQRDACFPDELGGAAPQTPTAYTVQEGDTLSKLAASLQRQAESKSNLVEPFVRRAPMSPAYLPPRAPMPRAQGMTAGALACMGPPTKEVQL